jgi:hypothetical protein
MVFCSCVYASGSAFKTATFRLLQTKMFHPKIKVEICLYKFGDDPVACFSTVRCCDATGTRRTRYWYRGCARIHRKRVYGVRVPRTNCQTKQVVTIVCRFYAFKQPYLCFYGFVGIFAIVILLLTYGHHSSRYRE